MDHAAFDLWIFFWQKLEEIVTDVIQKHGVSPEDPIYKSCIQKLFKVTKIFVMVSLMTLTLYCTVGQGALMRNL